MTPRKKVNDSKINVTISVIFHTVMIGGIFFFAAREGMLGKKLKEITVTLALKEKKPEPPREKPPEPKVEPPKETPKPADTPQPKVQTAAVAPPPSIAAPPPSAAPAVASLPAFEFSDGAKQVDSLSDPNAIYKALVERSLRSRWNRPEDLNDDDFIAEVEVSIDNKGNVEDYRWVKGSGNKRWDESVKASMQGVKSIGRPPPKGFPGKFTARFDVEIQQTESLGLP